MIEKEKVTLVLPSELMAQVRALVPPRRQSEFIAEALGYYLAANQRRALRERLMTGYRAYAGEDLALTAEWQAVDDEAWLSELWPDEAAEDEESNDSAHSAW